MGDIADMLIDQIIDEMARGEGDYDRKICKYCGQDDLYWSETGQGWRLFSYQDNKMHSCGGARCAADMNTARKLFFTRKRCEAQWVTGTRSPCTQSATYKINKKYYCTTHAKILALKILVSDAPSEALHGNEGVK